MRAYTHTNTHILTDKHIHTYDTHTRTHRQTHTHTHILTDKHIHTHNTHYTRVACDILFQRMVQDGVHTMSTC